MLACEDQACVEKKNFDIVFGFKSYTSVLTFSFCFLSSPLLSLFLSHFFSFAEGFGNAFMILGLDQRKARWIVKQDYS